MAKKGSPTKKSTKTRAGKKTARKATASKKSMTSRKKSAVATAAVRKTSPTTVADQVHVKQSSAYRGNNSWNWAVWIEAPPAVLNNIEYVEYKLHSTFTDPVQHMTNRDEKFVLNSSGWGEFTINAEIKPKTGSKFKKRHWLTLEYPSAPQPMSQRSTSGKEKARNATVFLSAGLSDLTLGNVLAADLSQKKITVLKSDDLSSDLPWDVAIDEMIKAADLMVVLLSGTPTSWTMRELDVALSRKLDILPIVIGFDTVVPPQIQSLQAINVKDGNELEKNTPHVATQIINRIKIRPRK